MKFIHLFLSSNRNIKDKKFQLQTALSRLEKEKEDILRLKEKVRKLKIRPISREEALNRILESTEYFVRIYDAKITQSLSEKGGIYVITVSFDYYPESSKDLIHFLSELNNIKSPQIVIDKFRLDNLKEGTKTYFEITLKQPFEGQG
ncbi:MAG: hypothetical protein Q9M89_09705 [Persephonella sp.]|nr:hypothetical protein [Persephonella sp.]